MDPDPGRRHFLWQTPVGLSAWLGSAAAANSTPSPRLLCGELPPLTEANALAGRVSMIARSAGHMLPPEPMPWQRAWREARDIGCALMFPVARTAERESHWHWLALLSVEHAVLLVRRDALPPGWCSLDLASLRHLRVGALRDSALQSCVMSQGFTNIEPAPNDRINAVKLSMNRIQAWAAVGSVADHWLAQESIPSSTFVRLQGPDLPLYLAATLDVPAASLARWKEAGLHQGGGGSRSLR